MVFSARFKINAFIKPSHCPVNLPCKLGIELCSEIKCSPVSACTFILCNLSLIIIRCYGCCILAAARAVNTCRIVFFSFSFFCILGSEAVKDIKYLCSLFHCKKYKILVFSASVHLRLVSEVHVDMERLDGFHELLFEI